MKCKYDSFFPRMARTSVSSRSLDRRFPLHGRSTPLFATTSRLPPHHYVAAPAAPGADAPPMPAGGSVPLISPKLPAVKSASPHSAKSPGAPLFHAASAAAQGPGQRARLVTRSRASKATAV
jgi:hypothetical protein